jgi:gamma-glutamyltranspeptidase/glutathione hydrolase
MVGGWLTLLRDRGTMRLRDVLEPAIFYARHGYSVTTAMHTAIADVASLFQEHWPASAALYLPGGAVPAKGSRLCNPVLADTFDRLRREGEAQGGGRKREIDLAYRAFYSGFVAEAIDRFCANEEVFDSSGNGHRGVLTGEDMARWQPTYEQPLTYDYSGWTVCKTRGWGQGPAMLETLALLAGFDLGALDLDGEEFIHLFVETWKLALADREAWLGDSDPAPLPAERLLAPDYIAERRTLIGASASRELRPGQPDGRAPRLATIAAGEIATASGVGEPSARGLVAADTVHVSVVDRFGNMVSCMPSGGWLQSSPVIPELGFPLGTRAQMFWVEEGLAASLLPGKRPRTTLSPGLALREGKPALAWGSPGGDGQDQWASLMFLRHVHGGRNLQEAIDSVSLLSLHAPNSFYPRQPRPAVLQVEERMTAETQEALAARGHELERTGPWTQGRLCAVGCEPDGTLKAGANPRFMQNYAAGR